MAGSQANHSQLLWPGLAGAASSCRRPPRPRARRHKHTVEALTGGGGRQVPRHQEAIQQLQEGNRRRAQQHGGGGAPSPRQLAAPCGATLQLLLRVCLPLLLVCHQRIQLRPPARRSQRGGARSDRTWQAVRGSQLRAPPAARTCWGAPGRGAAAPCAPPAGPPAPAAPPARPLPARSARRAPRLPGWLPGPRVRAGAGRTAAGTRALPEERQTSPGRS
jgi:hypothetical protein